jgi:hypothetical protein
MACQMVRYTFTTRRAWGVSDEPGMETSRPSPERRTATNPSSCRNCCRSVTRRGLSTSTYKPQRRSGVAATESPTLTVAKNSGASRAASRSLAFNPLRRAPRKDAARPSRNGPRPAQGATVPSYPPAERVIRRSRLRKSAVLRLTGSTMQRTVGLESGVCRPRRRARRHTRLLVWMPGWWGAPTR